MRQEMKAYLEAVDRKAAQEILQRGGYESKGLKQRRVLTAFVEVAIRIYVLERGRIVELRQHQSLLEQKGLYYAMWRQQIGEREEELSISGTLATSNSVGEN